MCKFSAKLPFAIGAHITPFHNTEVETGTNEQHTIVSKEVACIKRNMCQVLGMLLYLDICIKEIMMNWGPFESLHQFSNLKI